MWEIEFVNGGYLQWFSQIRIPVLSNGVLARFCCTAGFLVICIFTNVMFTCGTEPETLVFMASPHSVKYRNIFIIRVCIKYLTGLTDEPSVASLSIYNACMHTSNDICTFTYTTYICHW